MTLIEKKLNELIANMTTRHVNHAELEPLKQEILQEALRPTAYQLEYCDGEYVWALAYAYNKSDLEKTIADVAEYDKTIKDLDFDDDDAVIEWSENHPLAKFDGYKINALLDIVDDVNGTWADYLTIETIKINGVQSE